MQSKIIILESEDESAKFAKDFSKKLKPNDVVTFTGELGSGKTFLCREIIKNLCRDDLQIISPTFNLLQTYEYKNILIYHFDLYRLRHSSEIYELGIEEALSGNICLIEWPEIISAMLPKDKINITIEIIDNQKRKLYINHSL